MKSISYILQNVKTEKIIGDVNINIANVTFDSRKVSAETLFVAQKGTLTDGHQYINQAISSGATAILCEVLPENMVDNITYIQVIDANEALSFIAANFYDHPSKKLKLLY